MGFKSAKRVRRPGKHAAGSHVKGSRGPSRSASRKASKNYSRNHISYMAPASSRGMGDRKVPSGGQSMLRAQRKRRKVILGVVVAVAIILVGGAAAAFAYTSYINGQLHSGIEDMDALNEALVVDSQADTDPFYILLLGTDKRDPDEADRSDTIILARVDPEEKLVMMVSIPRDTRVYIDGVGYTKINAAHAYGGAAGAVEAVEDFAGVQISHYAEIDFSGFVDLVDALGGVEVDVPFEIDDEKAGGHVDAGLQVLDGEHALIFCRSRDAAVGDYQRQSNQRSFLMALASKVLDSDAVTMLSAVNSIASAVGTDMTVDEIQSIAGSLSGIGSDNIYSYTVPSYGQYVDGVSYVLCQESDWQELMEQIDSGQIPPAQDASLVGIISSEYQNADSSDDGSGASTGSGVDRASYKLTVRNGGGIEGAVAEASEILQSAGYAINDTGNANQFVYDDTMIIYNEDADMAAANDLVAVLGKGTVVQSLGRYSFDGDILVVIGADWE